jgi:hypothetical protein
LWFLLPFGTSGGFFIRRSLFERDGALVRQRSMFPLHQYVLRIRGIAISNFAIVGIIEVTLAGQKNDLARYRLRHYDPAD